MIFNAYADGADGWHGVALRSCGHIFAKKGRKILRPEGRSDWLLFYIAKGSEHFFLEREIDAAEGSFIFFKPFEKQHHVCLEEKTAEFYYLHFTAPSALDLLGFESATVYAAKPCPKIRELFEEILAELQTKQPCYEKLCVAKFFEIVALLSRRAANLSDPHERYAGQIAGVLQLMNREYGENRSLEEYAQLCRMSKFHFLRVFREITGYTPMEYRNKLRMEHARELLEDGDLGVSEIGARLGYASASYFCDAFKRKTGVSPTQYQQRARKQARDRQEHV